ncbi:hypothetical protein [Streptosporangium sp. NPDC003464]
MFRRLGLSRAGGVRQDGALREEDFDTQKGDKNVFRQKGAVKPRHVLCVLGSDLDVETVREVVGDVAGIGFTVDREGHRRAFDPRMPRSFEACMADVSFTESDWEAVKGHDSVVYVLSPPMQQHRSFDPRYATPADDAISEELWTRTFDVSRRMLEVTAALLRSGATAVKNESSGLAHGRDRWLTLADKVSGAPNWAESAITLFRAWVKRPISDGSLMRSCGMHLLGAPDVEVDLVQPVSRHLPGELLEGGVQLIDEVAFYLLVESRALEITDGEGFRLAPDAQRWIMHRHPCQGYEEDSFFFNPYGYWRLTPDGSSPPTFPVRADL